MGRRCRDRLGIEDISGLKEESTVFAGVGLLVDVYRQAGIGATAEKALPQKRSPRGLKQGPMVEAFVILSSLGGDSTAWVRMLNQTSIWLSQDACVGV